MSVYMMSVYMLSVYILLYAVCHAICHLSAIADKWQMESNANKNADKAGGDQLKE